jgi:hypothetical protein
MINFLYLSIFYLQSRHPQNIDLGKMDIWISISLLIHVLHVSYCLFILMVLFQSPFVSQLPHAYRNCPTEPHPTVPPPELRMMRDHSQPWKGRSLTIDSCSMCVLNMYEKNFEEQFNFVVYKYFVIHVYCTICRFLFCDM